jgi:hypothetical protein
MPFIMDFQEFSIITINYIIYIMFVIHLGQLYFMPYGIKNSKILKILLKNHIYTLMVD